MIAYTFLMANYSMGELAEMVQDRVPGARIDFEVDEERQALLDHAVKPIDDRFAQQEWGWKASYGLEEMVDDFLRELRENAQRYES
jgi:nucleoside-diphosphate-sugar epimerase